MNREILFRGYNYQYQKWFYGSLIIKNYEGSFILSDTETIIVDDRLNQAVVDRSTIGQYTGLTDKNGKKIFEGDILGNKKEKYKFIVKYNHHRMGFSLFPTDDTFPCDDMPVNVERKLPYEVIGNIYESKINE